MLPDLLGFSVAALVLAVPFVSRRVRAGRVRAAGTAAVPPVRRRAAGGVAVPRPEVQPRGEMTEPYAYDDGLISGEGP